MIEFKNYTNEEIDYIKENYSNKTIKELANKLDKTCGSITNVVRRLGLVKQSHKPWTEEDVAYLQANYKNKTSEEIAKSLGRTVHSVNAQRDRLELFKHEPWNECEVGYLIENFETMTHLELGKRLKRTEQAVRAKCFELDLYKKEKPWTKEDLNFVKENYMEMNTSDIAKVLNRTKDAVQLKARRMGLKKYPYTCDYHYFDVIDTEEKAYWLGFLTADGWINKNEKNNSGVVGVELQYSDINHLKKFNKSLNGNYQITDRWRPCVVSANKKKKNHSCVLRIFSITMYNSLVKLGFSNNKSFDVNIPYLKKDLVRHYIRGYFDGDGSFCFTNKSFHVDFVSSSKQLSEDLIKIVNEMCCEITENCSISENGTTIYRPSIYTLDNKVKFLDWIYKDCNIYLDRKYKKYLKVKEKYGSTLSLAV